MFSERVGDPEIAFEIALAAKPFIDRVDIGAGVRNTVLHPFKTMNRRWYISRAAAVAVGVEREIATTENLQGDVRVELLWHRFKEHFTQKDNTAFQEISAMMTMPADELYKFTPKSIGAQVAFALGRAVHHNGTKPVLQISDYQTADANLFLSVLHELCETSGRRGDVNQPTGIGGVINTKTKFGFSVCEVYRPAYEGNMGLGVATVGAPLPSGLQSDARPSSLTVTIIEDTAE